MHLAPHSQDDCYIESRSATGELQPDPVTFPSGMKALGNYLHSKVRAAQQSCIVAPHPTALTLTDQFITDLFTSRA